VAVPTATQIISSRCFFSDFLCLPNSRELLPRIPKPFWVYREGERQPRPRTAYITLMGSAQWRDTNTGFTPLAWVASRCLRPQRLQTRGQSGGQKNKLMSSII
jgi:hypothetical protein